MEDQVRDAFFDDLRSLARNIEKGHQEVKTALDTDAESTEQLDNLRGVLSAAKSLKEKSVTELSAANSAHAEHTQALGACRKTLDKCRQSLDKAVGFLEQYGYTKASTSASQSSAVQSPVTVACSTTPTPSVSQTTRESLVADGSTPTIEKAGISARTLASLRRSQVPAVPQSAIQPQVQSAVQPHLYSVTRAQDQSVVQPHLQSAIHSAVPVRSQALVRTPEEDDLNKTLAELNIGSVSVLGPRQRTGAPLTAMRNGVPVASQSYAPPVEADCTMQIMGHRNLHDPLQTPQAQQLHSGFVPASSYANQYHQSYQPVPHQAARGGIPFAIDPASAFTTPAVPPSHGMDYQARLLAESAQSLQFADEALDPETPRQMVQSSQGPLSQLVPMFVTPSAGSAFNPVSQPPTVVKPTPMAQQTVSTANPEHDLPEIPQLDIQSVKVLPPGHSTRLQPSTTIFSSGTNAEVGQTPASADDTLTPEPHHLSSDVACIRPVTESEYDSTPQYLRFQLTFEAFNEIVAVINQVAASPRGDIPAGQFTLPELRSIPVVGAKAQVIYLLLVKLKRIRVTDVADEAYAIM